MFSFRIKATLNNKLTKILNGFKFMGTKTKVSRRQIFTNLSVPENWYTQKFISQKLIFGEIKFLKVTKEIPVNTRSKLNVQKVLIWSPERHVNVSSEFSLGCMCSGIYLDRFSQYHFEHLLWSIMSNSKKLKYYRKV